MKFFAKVLSFSLVLAIFIVCIFSFSTISTLAVNPGNTVTASTGEKLISEQLIPAENSTFESGETTWAPFLNGSVTKTTDVFHADKNSSVSSGTSLKFTGRVNKWDSPYLNIYNIVKANGAGRYVVTFWLSVDNIGEPDLWARMLIRGNSSDANSFITQTSSNYYAVIGRSYVSKEPVEKNKDVDERIWYKMSGTFDVLESDITRNSGNFKLMLDELFVCDDQVLYIDEVCMYKLYNQITEEKCYYIKNQFSGQYLTYKANDDSDSNIDTLIVQDHFSSISSKNTDVKQQKWILKKGNKNDEYYITSAANTKAITINNPDSNYGINSYLSLNDINSSLNSQTFKIKISGDGITYRIIAQTGVDYLGVRNKTNGGLIPYTPILIRISNNAALTDFQGTDCWYFEPCDEYSKANAVTYATLNYDNYSPIAYPYLDNGDNFSDCTNFASQCLNFAGITMNSDWYCKRLLNAYSQPQTSEEYDAAWECSDAWIKAVSFKDYFSSHSEEVISVKYKDLKNNPAYLQSEGCEPGDVVIFEKDNKAKHVGIITSNSTNSSLGITFGASYHTASRLNKNLFDTAEGLGLDNNDYIYVIKFS